MPHLPKLMMLYFFAVDDNGEAEPLTSLAELESRIQDPVDQTLTLTRSFLFVPQLHDCGKQIGKSFPQFEIPALINLCALFVSVPIYPSW